MKNLFDIKDNVTVITGGTGVLGRTIAKYLALNGAKVIILGRKEDVGQAIVDDIKNDGGQCEFMKTDVMDEACVQKNCDDIIANFVRIDTLLNAAGGNMPGATIGPDKTFFDLDASQFSKVLELNLTGTVIPTQIFLKPMVKQGKGSIINFSSMAAFRPMTRVCGYAAAKAGISNFTQYMATECAKKFGEGIRVNAIAPGFFITEQNRSLLTNPDGTYTQRGQDVIRQTPFGRMGEPEELCGTIHYLMSDASKFVTGTVAVVDGDKISVRDYEEAKERNVGGRNNLTSDQTYEISNSTLEQMIKDNIMGKEYEAAGFGVTTDELMDQLTGEKPHQWAIQNFGDGNGNVDKQRVNDYIQNLSTMPAEYYNQWVEIEKYLKKDRLEQKFNMDIRSRFMGEIFRE